VAGAGVFKAVGGMEGDDGIDEQSSIE